MLVQKLSDIIHFVIHNNPAVSRSAVASHFLQRPPLGVCPDEEQGLRKGRKEGEENGRDGGEGKGRDVAEGKGGELTKMSVLSSEVYCHSGAAETRR